ncbi:MAG: Fic family protein [Leptospiraceae bacterium]|nr:Fic family protein [Leptospiraceae bacterium]MBK9498100.1 Fic family protein [Leptospiraceae bacterium]MBP9163264.1 Fic family protein [Leptospiraceae bacterium]
MKPKLLKSLLGKKKELDKYRPLDKAIVDKLREQFLVEWTYNSNAIEGNTLTLQETELVLRNGITIGNKSLREHFEVINHKAGIDFIYNTIKKKTKLSKTLILNLHELILTKIDDENAGVFRRTQVRILGSRHIPPNPLKINSLIEDMVGWYYEHYPQMSVPELAAWVHFKFVHIHPFIDGNGRTARLIMNLILMQHGYPPAVILHLDRKKYYRVLREADSDKFDSYMDFIGRSIERSLIIYLQAVTPVKPKSKQGYISLSEATKYCDYSMEYLSLLARKGRLPAVKLNRNWMTTREAVENYIAELGK